MSKIYVKQLNSKMGLYFWLNITCEKRNLPLIFKAKSPKVLSQIYFDACKTPTTLILSNLEKNNMAAIANLLC